MTGTTLVTRFLTRRRSNGSGPSIDDSAHELPSSSCGQHEPPAEPKPKYIVQETKDLTLYQLCCLEVLNDPFLMAYFMIRPGLEVDDLKAAVSKVTMTSDESKHVMRVVKVADTMDLRQQFREQLFQYKQLAARREISHVELKANYQEFVNDIGLRGILLPPRTRAQLAHLRSISLVRCTMVTDKALIAIAKAYSPQLTELAVQGTKVSGKGVRAVADYLPYLTTLDVSRLRDMFDADIEYLARRCSRLSTLDLSYVAVLTDRSLSAIGQHCKRLTTLRIAFNHNVSGGVGALSNCMHLQTLHLQHCVKVMDSDLLPVVSTCLLLQQLSVRGCQMVTSQVIRYVADHCMCMRLIDVVDTQVDGRNAFALLAHSPSVRRSLKEYTSNNMTALHITPELYRLYKV